MKIVILSMIAALVAWGGDLWAVDLSTWKVYRCAWMNAEKMWCEERI